MSEAEADPRVRVSLAYAVKDGVAWALMHAIGERYIGPFVIQGTNADFWKLAALAALPSLGGAFVMWFAANVVDRAGQRKKYIIGGVFLQSMTWLIAAWAVLVHGDARYWMMLLAYVLFLGLHNFTAPIWTSVMGDLVPEERRGRYFGSRNLAVGIAIWIGTYAAGEWLGFYQGSHGGPTDYYGYFVLFIGAMGFRLLSCYYLSQMHEPSYHPKKEEIFTMAEFIKRAPKGNFGRFVFYQTMFYMGSSIAGAYFGWYWLDASGLNLNMRDYAILTLFQMITLFGAQPIIGRIADRIGNKKVMAWGGLGIALIPALWLVSRDFAYCCAVQIYDGVVWAAFSLASWNYIFDCVTPPKRARCMAFYTFFVLGIGSTIGCFVGASIAELVAYPVGLFGFSIGKFELLLIVSFFGRLWPSLALLPTFKEMRIKPVEKIA